MKKTAYAICIVSGIIFIFAGIVKLFPISLFEFQLVTQLGANYSIAPYLSRLLIGSEILLGIGLLQKYWLKRVVIPASVLMLIVFSIFLVITTIRSGNSGNCGCFGQILPMSNTAALIKNIIIVALLTFSYLRLDFDKEEKLLYSVFAAFIVYGILFIAFPMNQYVVPVAVPAPVVLKDTVRIVIDSVKPAANNLIKTVIKDTLRAEAVLEKTASVYTSFNTFITTDGNKTIDLNDGKKVVAILSLDCDHCQETSIKLADLLRKHKIPKVYALFWGDESQVKPFFEKTGLEFPYMILPAEKFFPLLEKSPPRIAYLNNGNVLGDWSGEGFSVEKLLESLSSK